MRKYVLFCFIVILAGCGGGGGSSPKTNTNTNTTTDNSNNSSTYLSAYLSNSPYANILESCVLAETRTDACYLNQLPLIGKNESIITKASIAERLVISHPWMGDRFMAFLDEMPQEIIQLFGAVSAVVIAYDIRPSFYWRLTNAIYLDPADLWLTNAEKATIASDPDYRSGFGSKLKFLSTWDYMDGRYLAWDYYALDGTEERTLADILAPNAQLLLHELAHANDVFPPALWSTINHSKKPDLAAADVQNQWASVKLSNSFPLNAQLLYDIGEVLFDGIDPSQEILDLTAYDVGIAFEPDGANDDYNYASIREDVAMLFEEAMMWHLFSLDRVTAYLDVPTVSDPICDDYLTGWGQRGRISSEQITPRLKLVLQHILPALNAEDVINGLPAPIDFERGLSYCDNIIQSSNERNLISPNIPRIDGVKNFKLSPSIFKKELHLQ